MIKSQFWEFLINSSYFLYTFKSRCTNWFQVRVLRRHNKFQIAGKPYKNQTRIAIIALWPRPAILKSVLRLIDFFIEEKELADDNNEATFLRPVIETAMLDKGLLYKPLAKANKNDC